MKTQTETETETEAIFYHIDEDTEHHLISNSMDDCDL